MSRLNQNEIETKAYELCDCLRIWDINQKDAIRIIALMEAIAVNRHDWNNPAIASLQETKQ